MPAIVAGTEYLVEESLLDRAPSVDDLPDELRRPLTPREWIITLGGALALAVMASGVALAAVALPGREALAPGAAFVVGAVALIAMPRLGQRFDVRIVLALGALLVAVVAVVPPGFAEHFGGRLLIAVVAVLLAVLTGMSWRQMRRAETDALIWNTAYAQLAADPQRAVSARLDVTSTPAGRGKHLVDGTVQFIDAAGQQRSAPLLTAVALKFLLDDDQQVSSDSACVVWHDPGITVVLTRVLLDRERHDPPV